METDQGNDTAGQLAGSGKFVDEISDKLGRRLETRSGPSRKGGKINLSFFWSTFSRFPAKIMAIPVLERFRPVAMNIHFGAATEPS
jgi:hypothetical protein